MVNSIKDIEKIILDYFQGKNYSLKEFSKEIRNLEKNLLLSYKTKGNYVIKKDGSIQEYSSEKLSLSIANASDDIKKPLNSSELKNIVKMIENKLFKEKKVAFSRDVRERVINELNEMGYKDISKSYNKDQL